MLLPRAYTMYTNQLKRDDLTDSERSYYEDALTADRKVRRERHEYLMTHCPSCADQSHMPSHDGSVNCESGSIASGGQRSHCSCDTCF